MLTCKACFWATLEGSLSVLVKPSDDWQLQQTDRTSSETLSQNHCLKCFWVLDPEKLHEIINAFVWSFLVIYHMLAKLCSKFSKPGFNSTWTVNFQMFKLDLEKAGEPEIKLPTSIGSSKKQESSGKTSTSALLTTPKPLTVWITTNCGKFWKRWEYQTTWPASWEICMQVRKQQLEPNVEQQTGSK